jgi:hypothetical protein
MTDVVQALQLVSGLMWLATALYLTPHLALVWRQVSDRTAAIFARNSVLAWLMFGFVVRWLLWDHSIQEMQVSEMVAWCGLYALSCVCAAWFLRDAWSVRKAR